MNQIFYFKESPVIACCIPSSNGKVDKSRPGILEDARRLLLYLEKARVSHIKHFR